MPSPDALRDDAPDPRKPLVVSFATNADLTASFLLARLNQAMPAWDTPSSEVVVVIHGDPAMQPLDDPLALLRDDDLERFVVPGDLAFAPVLADARPTAVCSVASPLDPEGDARSCCGAEPDWRHDIVPLVAAAAEDVRAALRLATTHAAADNDREAAPLTPSALAAALRAIAVNVLRIPQPGVHNLPPPVAAAPPPSPPLLSALVHGSQQPLDAPLLGVRGADGPIVTTSLAALRPYTEHYGQRRTHQGSAMRVDLPFLRPDHDNRA